MKEFFIKLGDHPIYKKLLKEPLTYVAGAVLLSVFQIAHFTVFEKGWGVTSTFAVWGTWFIMHWAEMQEAGPIMHQKRCSRSFIPAFWQMAVPYEILVSSSEHWQQPYLHHSLK